MTHRPRALATLVVLVLLLVGCTGETPPEPVPTASPVNAPALPAAAFPALPARGSGVETTIEAMTGDGSTLVMVVTVEGRASLPVLRSSTDAGATWTDGRLTDEAARATEVGEAAVGVAAVARIGSERRWLALGETRDSIFAWTSADALTWARTPLVGIDADNDQIQSVAGFAGGGFVAVGYTWTAARTTPRIWTSPDGITWTRSKPPAGEGSLSEVATSGDRVVAVGSHDLPAPVKGRSAEALLYTSIDRAGSWRSVRVREPSDSGNFIAQLGEVTDTDTGFVVGGSYYDKYEDTYRPLLLSSSDLTRWQHMRRLREYDESSSVHEVLAVGSTTVVVQGSETADARDKLAVHYLRPGSAGWARASSGVSRESVTEAAGAVVGEGMVIGVHVDTRPATSTLWRYDKLPNMSESAVTAPDAEAVIRPSGLMLADGGLAAYGTAQGAEVWWPAQPGGFGTPQVVLDEAGAGLGQLRWSRAGGFVAGAWGAGNNAFVLHSKNGTTWSRTPTTTFGATNQYHYSEINDVTWAHGRWVVVGEKSTNGSIRRSALAYTSTDGDRWVQGRPTKVTARGDWYRRSSPLDDLHGLDNRGRSMNAVLGMAKGLLAVGETSKARYYRPAAWLSTDSRTWRLIDLDSPGYVSAGVYDVRRVGDTVVALGWALAAKAKRRVRATWRSADGGRTWRFQAFEGGYAGAMLAAGEREFVTVVRSDDQRTLTLHRSTDGLTWTAAPLTVSGLADGMQVYLEEALVDGGSLHPMLTLATRLDATTIVQTVPL